MHLHPGAGYLFLSVAALALFLWRAAKSERRTVSLFSLAFVASFAGMAASGWLTATEYGAAAEVVWDASVLVEGLCIISLVTIALCRQVLPRLGFRSPRILQEVILAVGYFVWTLVWLRRNHVDVTSVIATSAVVTAVIGFSLQDTLGNILGGIALQFDQSVQAGEWIKVDDQVGKVVEITWRHTSIETRNWETVVLPNSYLVKNKFVVLGRRLGEPTVWRRTVTFNVDYRYTPSQIIAAVQEAMVAANIPRVAKYPRPQCLLMDFNDSFGRYAVRYWLDDLSTDDPTDSDVRQQIYFALKRAAIPLSIPAQALFLTNETAERKVSKAEQALTQRMETLRQMEFFGGLHPVELRRIAECLVPAPFAANEVITQEGGYTDGLFLLASGKAQVMVRNEAGRSTCVAELGPGSIFGEMGMMAASHGATTVVAATATECFHLDKLVVEELMHTRPTMGEEIAGQVARRRLELDKALRTLNGSKDEDLATAQRDILDGIRRFFSLK